MLSDRNPCPTNPEAAARKLRVDALLDRLGGLSSLFMTREPPPRLPALREERDA